MFCSRYGVSNRRDLVAVPAALQGGTLRPYQLDGLRFLLSLYNNRLNGAAFHNLCGHRSCHTAPSTSSLRLLSLHTNRVNCADLQHLGIRSMKSG